MAQRCISCGIFYFLIFKVKSLNVNVEYFENLGTDLLTVKCMSQSFIN